MRSSLPLFLALPLISKADTAADCHYEVIKGTWNFEFTDGGLDNTVDCDSPLLEYKHKVSMDLHDINVATRKDSYASVGDFTLIYQQGFEINIDERKWFAYFTYDPNFDPWQGDDPRDYYNCTSTMNGWVHDKLSNDWACFRGVHADPEIVEKRLEMMNAIRELEFYEKKSVDASDIDELPFNTGNMPDHPSIQYQRRKRSAPTIRKSLKTEIDTARTKSKEGSLPSAFDWNDSGMVSPVKNQGGCGSCYAFASVGMFESRARVQRCGRATNDSNIYLFSN